MFEDPTSFYDLLAPMFDVMTDWEARLAAEGPFLRAVLDRTGARRVLDAACGSGGHALALARWGYDVAGADISPGMIRLAQSKATKAELSVPFVVSDLASLPDHFQPFDAVLCLGNSLPHLLSVEDLAGALQGIAAVLRPGGTFIAQNLNYDLRWQRQPRFFGAQGGILDGQEVLVWRFADYDQAATRIAFNIALFRKEEQGWQVQVHTTPQRPLFHDDLTNALTSTGFRDSVAYGGMAWPAPPFDPSASGDLVIVTTH